MTHFPQSVLQLIQGWHQQYENAAFMGLVVLSALAFTVGGIFMKLSDGLSKAIPTAALMFLFLVGACLQTLAMKREDLAVTYLVVLGLEAVLAFGFGVLFFGESSSQGRIAGVVLITLGIGSLRFTS
ncbi:MAG: DMT family transporter [Hyphomicrobium sp.]